MAVIFTFSHIVFHPEVSSCFCTYSAVKVAISESETLLDKIFCASGLLPIEDGCVVRKCEFAHN